MAYHILWIDDDPDFLLMVRNTLKDIHAISTAASLAQGLQLLKRETVDLVLLDMHIGPENGLDGLKQIKQETPSADVVMMTSERDAKCIVQAIRAGAADYLCKPFVPEELAALVEKLQAVKQIRDRHDALIADLNPVEARARFIGVSPAFQRLIAQAERLKGHQANVLLEGESGTGKELLARFIHSLEDQPQRPFIAVNCAAIPEGLIESELFGHEKGAFTGAVQRKIGKFELANGGDIFLDEISALRLDLQAKILRVLQEREIVRVGGNTPIRVNFRVLAATNDSLEQQVARGVFRMDLFHRLRVIPLHIPALRERQDDIPLLITYFLEKFSAATGAKRITAEAMDRLQEYAWPGNVRELENVIHSLMILTPHDIIDEPHLPQWALTGAAHRATHVVPTAAHAAAPDANTLPALREYVRQIERQYIEHVLRVHGGDKSRTANALAVGRTTLYGKLKELGLM